MPSYNPYKPLVTLKGKQSKRTFRLFWNTEDHYVYVEKTGFLGSTTKVRTPHYTSSWEMAYHAAEAYVYDK